MVTIMIYRCSVQSSGGVEEQGKEKEEGEAAEEEGEEGKKHHQKHVTFLLPTSCGYAYMHEQRPHTHALPVFHSGNIFRSKAAIDG